MSIIAKLLEMNNNLKGSRIFFLKQCQQTEKTHCPQITKGLKR
jgi:hypothetical protein